VAQGEWLVLLELGEGSRGFHQKSETDFSEFLERELRLGDEGKHLEEGESDD
jgi:hypothetical protein